MYCKATKTVRSFCSIALDMNAQMPIPLWIVQVQPSAPQGRLMMLLNITAGHQEQR